jgi:hypothetical protein
MKRTRTDLIKISTYAKQMGVSTTWVYKQAKDQIIEIVEIDGVKFVKPKQDQ